MFSHPLISELARNVQHGNHTLLYMTDSEYRNLAELGLDSTVQVNQETMGTVRSCFEELLLKQLVPVLQKYIDEKRFGLFKTSERFKSCFPRILI